MKVHGWGKRGNYPLPGSKIDPETGKRLCRWCEFPVPKGRLYWCGKVCIAEYRLRSDWGHLRDLIIERDCEKGCWRCGGQRYFPRGGQGFVMPARRPYAYGWLDRDTQRVDFWGEWTAVARGWEVDHLKPIADGGDDNPANLRLLCVPCHREVTSAWRLGRALTQVRLL